MNKNMSWQPNISIKNLIERSKIISNIRLFFLQKNVMEVETPMLSTSTVTDVHLSPFQTEFLSLNQNDMLKLWLITSPEYHMKRLLAATSGPIYQICHCFRNQEVGRYHNPEFTMLEWYQPFFSMKKFIKEIDLFLQTIFNFNESEKISYQDIFLKTFDIDPLCTNILELRTIFKKLKLDYLIDDEHQVNDLIQILFTLEIEPHLGKKNPIFIYHFPAEQACLASINSKDSRISERFEFFFKGIELGNGFYELTDFDEQKKRFTKDNKKRASMNLPMRKIDNFFLDALSSGLPCCSGVAIGLDRLMMLLLKEKNINKVLSFAIDRC
jgi:lysyl-tRNA synthetase class 2